MHINQVTLCLCASSCLRVAVVLPTADRGDLPWDGVIPQAVQAEIKDAKGKVYEMEDDPWW